MTEGQALSAQAASGERRARPLTPRPMDEPDLPAVVALDHASHLTPWSEANFRDALAAGNLCLVVERDATIVGCAVVQMAGGEADLLTIAVATAARRDGIGRELLDAAIRRTGASGASAIFLDVRASNVAAIGLYRAAGFEEVGSRKNYYERGAGREDAITMRLALQRKDDDT